MDFTGWTEMQPPNPNPNPSHIDPYSRHIYTTQGYYSYYSDPQSQNHNPNSHLPIAPNKPQQPNYNSAGLNTAVEPSGTDPNLSMSSYVVYNHGGGYEAHQTGGVAYSHPQAIDAGSVAAQPAYYLDPNTGTVVQNWANPYLTAGMIPPNGTQQLVPAIPTVWTNPTNRPRGTWKKVPKKTKVVQSAWCEVCKVECNTKDVLVQHKLGKKHKKNLDKQAAATAPAPAPAPAPVASAMLGNPVIAPPENPANVISVKKSKKKKAVESVEDLERKKRKVLEGGAAADCVKTCAVCNVVCNSETVFKFHVAGQKHIALMKKHAFGKAIATAT